MMSCFDWKPAGLVTQSFTPPYEEDSWYVDMVIPEG